MVARSILRHSSLLHRPCDAHGDSGTGWPEPTINAAIDSPQGDRVRRRQTDFRPSLAQADSLFVFLAQFQIADDPPLPKVCLP
jgi:hypothetical protein